MLGEIIKESDILYGNLTKKWIDEKRVILRDNTSIKSCMTRDVINQFIHDYIVPWSQLEFTFDAIILNKLLVNDTEYDNKCHQSYDSYKIWLLKDVTENYDVVLKKIRYMKDRYHIYLIDEFMKCKFIYMKTPKLIINAVNTSNDQFIVLKCSYVEDKDIFQRNIWHVRYLIEKLLEISNLDIKNIDTTGDNINLVLVYTDVLSRKIGIYDKDREKMRYDKKSELYDVFQEGVVIQGVLYIKDVYKYIETGWSYNILNTEVSQLKIFGKLPGDFFTKPEFIDDNYHILTPMLDYNVFKRELTSDNKYTIDNLSSNILSYAINDPIYIQTPFMKVAFDVSDNGQQSVFLVFDNLQDLNQSFFYNDMKCLQTSIIEYMTKSRLYGSPDFYNFYNIINEHNKIYDPYIKVCSVYVDSGHSTEINVINKDGECISFNDAVKHYLKRGTLVQAIYTYNHSIMSRESNNLVRTYYLAPILKQMMIVESTVLDDDCIIESDSEGW